MDTIKTSKEIIDALASLADRETVWRSSEVNMAVLQTIEICRKRAVEIVLDCNGWSYTAIAKRLEKEL